MPLRVRGVLEVELSIECDQEYEVYTIVSTRRLVFGDLDSFMHCR